MLIYNKNPQIIEKKINIFNSNNIIKLLHISDLHLDCWNFNSLLFIEKINKIDFDFIILNGDILDNYNYSNQELDSFFKIFLDKHIFDKIIITIGNHEKHNKNNLNNSIEYFKQKKFNLLINNDYLIYKNIKILGVTDYHFNQKEYQENINNINSSEDNKIIISHNPIIQKDIINNNTKNLILSGHTHGGQIYPFGYIQLKELKGLHKRGIHLLNENNLLYISNGAGYSKKFKLRLFANNYIDYLIIN